MTWLHNARLPDGRTVDIEVVDGAIAALDDHGSRQPKRTGHDLAGWLLLPALAEPHAHLDKALTADVVPNPGGDLIGAVEAWADAAAAGRFTVDDVIDRATTALDLMLVHGVTAVRTHVNVTPEVGAEAVRALNVVRSAFAGAIDLQVVALTGAPMLGAEGAAGRRALAEAIEEGVDVVGGCPHLDTAAADSVRYAFDIAEAAGLDIDLHTDETLDPAVLTVRDMARRVLDGGFGGMVAASHCVSLGMASPEIQAQVSREIADADIAVFALPQTNLYLQGRDLPTATPRGLTAVRSLRAAGVLVGAGADNVQDPYNLVGRSDPLETAALMVMAGHVPPDDAYDMVSNNVRRAIGLAPVTMSIGDPADFVAIDASSVRAAIADAPMSRKVFKAGRLVASATQETRVHR